MASLVGQRVGSFEITALLGKGGMGEVYRAHDTKLKRDVAIKVLPDEFARDTERLARFQREAESLAALNHTNIAAIHDLHEANGSRFLILELVEGETLADRIARGPIPVPDALQFATQITEALEAAHGRGIVHRDVKPANIKITADGKVKVLDFGLAKAMERSPTTSNLSNSPTLSIAGTNAGLILGTASYMSPEQAKGLPVDRRTDIFAFGCVPYEMLTAKPAFDGEGIAEILSCVLQREADWSSLPSNVPGRIVEVLKLCLEKNVKHRRSDAADVRIDIERAVRELENPTVTADHTRHAPFPWILAGIATLAFGVVAALHFRETVPQAAELRLDINTPATTQPFHFALSPDGQTIAFIGFSGWPATPLGSPPGQHRIHSTQRNGKRDISILVPRQPLDWFCRGE